MIAARDDSPAAKAGLQTGDYVRAIDGKPARDLSVFEGMRLLRGAPGIEGHADDHPRQRRRAARRSSSCASARPARSSPSKMLAPDLGYIRIASFGAGRSRRRSAAQADALAKNGAKQLIVDIRRTAEGPFDTGIDAGARSS